MKQVTIYQLEPDGTQTVVAVCQLVGTQVSCQGEESFTTILMSEGITDYSAEPLTKVFPENGEIFLDQLQFNYRSGYLLATSPEVVD